MNLLRKIIKINFNFSIICYHVRERLMHSLIKITRCFGLYVQKLYDAESLYRHLTSDHVSIQEAELKKKTTYLRMANDNTLYSQILQKFVPHLKMDFDQSEFIGRGFSKTALNVYRKLTYEDGTLFEKVYFNSSHDLLRVKWFYENIHPLINSNIKVPSLYKSIKGELITVVYFKYVDLISLAMSDVNEKVFNHSKELYKLSFISNVKSKMKHAPEFLKDYKEHFLYLENIDKAVLKILELCGGDFPLKAIKKKIDESHHVLTHGDIHWGNIYENNYLIDWDSFGIYPKGLEVAYILFQLHQCKLSYKELNDVLEKEYQSNILEKEWHSFELNCLFFYFVFSVVPLIDINMDLSEAQSNILNRIEQLHYKYTL